MTRFGYVVLLDRQEEKLIERMLPEPVMLWATIEVTSETGGFLGYERVSRGRYAILMDPTGDSLSWALQILASDGILGKEARIR
jgi:hypothetical protein